MTTEQANATFNSAALAVRDLIQRAYEAGTRPSSGRVRINPMPSTDEINKALQAFDRAAVGLAHARMEETARMCGFEGLTEALGYLVCLRDNPIAGLVRDAIALFDRTALPSYAEHCDWQAWKDRAVAAVGKDAPPPETINVQTATGEALDALLQTIHHPTTLTAPNGERSTVGDTVVVDSWDFYGLPMTRVVAGVPVYYWAGRKGRATTSWCGRWAHSLIPAGAEHVVVDETRGTLSDTAPIFVCRIVESIEPFSLGHTLYISREELKPLREGSWVPEGGCHHELT